jgi:hypothetical protein
MVNNREVMQMLVNFMATAFFVLKKYTQILSPHQAKSALVIVLAGSVAGNTFAGAMENNGRGAKAVALANAFAAIADDPWAVAYNAAGLTQMQGFHCAAFFVPQQFGMPELQTAALAASMPVHFGTFGLKVERFGFDLYRETEIGVAFARKIDGRISAGLAVNLHNISIERYGSASRLTINAGMLARIFTRATLGCNLNNVARATVGKNNERLPQALSIGAGWNPLNNLLLALEVEKDTRYPASLKAGIEQRLVTALWLRGGIANNPDKYSIGLALRCAPVEFSYAGYSHTDLGWTHQVELSFAPDE